MQWRTFPAALKEQNPSHPSSGIGRQIVWLLWDSKVYRKEPGAENASLWRTQGSNNGLSRSSQLELALLRSSKGLGQAEGRTGQGAVLGSSGGFQETQLCSSTGSQSLGFIDPTQPAGSAKAAIPVPSEGHENSTFSCRTWRRSQRRRKTGVRKHKVDCRRCTGLKQ